MSKLDGKSSACSTTSVEPPKPFFLQALDALKGGDRRNAAALLARELDQGNTSPKNLGSVAQLAAHIGEVDLAIGALQRAASPGSLDSLLLYWSTLATFGRGADALAEVKQQPARVRDHPSVLHFRGTVANQFGKFDEAQDLFRRTLRQEPRAVQTWFALSMIKTFGASDPDLAAMEQLERLPGIPPEARAALHYAIAKAREDCGDLDRAFELYTKGAAVRRMAPFDLAAYRRAAKDVVRDFTPDNLKRLIPSEAKGQRAAFVTGLPRSGTTLTEQLLVGHSAVEDGAELNVFAAALIPTLGGNFQQALAFQQRAKHVDPWGEIGRDYAYLVDVHFRSSRLVVDKSLGQSLLIGLLLHSMPDARIAWLRRSPDDVALSCFRTFFTTGLNWTWSLTDIADYMRIEDELFEHWTTLFPERILVVPYEDLVSSPERWSQQLQKHFGLPIEAGAASVPNQGRAIRTASVTQVTRPISKARVGSAAAFHQHLKPFRERYYP
ncbi:MAG TPA: sulfotransferase [Sphingomicrobium sp.]|nr:sulfotransferase [Sphingomicrobium sp.]